MKRTIAIVMAAAIAAGTAFAQDDGIKFSGSVNGGINLVSGDNKEGTSPEAGGFLGNVKLEAEAQTETGVGTFGAWARLSGNVQGGEDPYGVKYTDDNKATVNGYAWWRPMGNMLELLVGANPDGHFGGRGVTGWNFYADAVDLGITVDNGSLGGTAGGIGDNALMLSVTPMATDNDSGLVEFNFAVPFIWMEAENANTRSWEVYRALLAEVAFNLDFGRILLGYKGYNPNKDWEFGGINTSGGPFPAGGFTNYGAIRAYLNLTAVENLAVNVGVRYILPGDKILDYSNFDATAAGEPDTKKVSHPLYVALGAQYDITEAFGLKTRLGMNFLGDYSVKYNVTTGVEDPDGVPVYYGGVNAPFRLQFDLLPYYDVNDNVRAYLNVGLVYEDGVKYKLANQTADTILRRSTFDWHVNPYVNVGIVGDTSFYAGIKLYSNTVQPGTAGNTSTDKTKSFVNWAVPIGVIVNF